MTKVIKLRKGLNINLKGSAAKEIVNISAGTNFALRPDDFVGVTPKVVVKEGDTVKAGTPLFVDKLHPEIKFTSPVSGVVSLVERGERRKVLSVRVKSDGQQQTADFGGQNVETLSADKVKELLCESGVFAFIKQRPYDVIANPNDTPKGIFVSCFNSMPLASDVDFVLSEDDNKESFKCAVEVLSKIAPVFLGISPKQSESDFFSQMNATINVFDGPAPAGNVGVQINHIYPINKGEIAWTLGAEEMLFVGRLFRNGHVDFKRCVALAGSQVKNPTYAQMYVGQQLSTLLEGRIEDGHNRIVNGNVMTGRKSTEDDFLAAHATEVNVIPEGDNVHEMLGWILPRFKEFSTSRSYFSWMLPKRHEYVLDARIKGGERHIIMSGEYDKVFPMDIFPEQLVKAIIAGDIDKMEALGIYEVAPEDFALCEFVDTSKLELQRIVREGLNMLRKENA
jgi:Na+-transporting NADH:ubiquinone oxidoreductase subunit A